MVGIANCLAHIGKFVPHSVRCLAWLFDHAFATAGPTQYFPPLAPVGAPAASSPGAEDCQPRNSNGSSSSGQEKGGYMVDSGSVRPLNPAEVQAAASMSSAQGTDSGAGTGETPAAQLISDQACACKGTACRLHLWDSNFRCALCGPCAILCSSASSLHCWDMCSA